AGQARRAGGRRGHGRRPDRDGHRHGQARRPGDRARALGHHARRRSAHRRGGSGRRGTIDRRADGAMTRAAPLADADYDVVIIGGGIAGAGAARDLALRGVSVALLDKGDFGSGTTSKSSKLVHGGLTPGADRERYRVLRPVDALSLEPALRARDLRGAGYYFDGLLLYPERLCLENVLSASRHGARVYNYADVEEVVRDARGTLTGVKVRDLLTGQVVTLGARVIVNATGPWVDQIRERARVT